MAKKKAIQKTEKDNSKWISVIVKVLLKFLPFMKKKIFNIWVWLVLLILAGVGMFFGIIPNDVFVGILDYFIDLLSEKPIAIC